MDKALEKARNAVLEYNSMPSINALETMRTVQQALAAGRKYVKTHTEKDPGCAQRLARNMDDLLDQLPTFRKLPGGKKGLPHLHGARRAVAHLDLIEDHVKSIVKNLEDEQRRRLHNWLKANPTLHELQRVASESVPKETYALLFQRSESGGIEILTQIAQDGRIFTRFRPDDLKDRTKLYKTFTDKSQVVGAVLIAPPDLLMVIGDVPEPEKDSDRLQHFLSLSSQATSKPARDFLTDNPVLKELHDLSFRHKLPKQAYILLFQEEAQPEPEVAKLDILFRTSANGKIVTRFWPSEFSERHKVFEEYRDKAPIVGAAVIKDKELLHVLGRVPDPAEGQSAADALLDVSWKALDKPALDFLTANDVLRSLHELSRESSSNHDTYVLLFTPGEAGRLRLMTAQPSNRRDQYKFYLQDFRSARMVHDRFSKEPVVAGASVIGEMQPPSRPHAAAVATKSKDGPTRSSRSSGRTAPERKSVVVTSFGKTPLKSGFLVSSESLSRLGIDLS